MGMGRGTAIFWSRDSGTNTAFIFTQVTPPFVDI